MSKRYIEDQWNAFSTKALKGIKSNSIQYIETRRAFYAGAIITISILMSNVSESENISEITPSDEQLMLDLQSEVEEWSERLRRMEV